MAGRFTPSLVHGDGTCGLRSLLRCCSLQIERQHDGALVVCSHLHHAGKCCS